MKSFGRVLGRILLVILCGVFLGVFIFAAYQLYTTFFGYHQASKAYENMNQQYVTEQTVAEATPTPTAEAQPEETPKTISGPISVDFAALQAQNSQVVGWIYSPDTVISYPVLKGTDNEYYLDHILDGTVNASGSIFMDYLCSPEFNQNNTLIYGHHMQNGSMFKTIADYKYEGYYAKHPTIYYLTPTKNYRFEVFAGFVTGGDSDVYAINFSSDAEFQAFIDTMRSRSNFDTNVQVSSADRIVTLSTCSYEFDDARYVVLCKVVDM